MNAAPLSWHSWHLIKLTRHCAAILMHIYTESAAMIYMIYMGCMKGIV